LKLNHRNKFLVFLSNSWISIWYINPIGCWSGVKKPLYWTQTTHSSLDSICSVQHLSCLSDLMNQNGWNWLEKVHTAHFSQHPRHRHHPLLFHHHLSQFLLLYLTLHRAFKS
jgi:hypothetical protein